MNRNFRGRGIGRGRRPRTRWQNYSIGGQQLYKDVNYLTKKVSQLSGLLNTEFKKIDNSANGTVSTTAGIVLLNGLAKGDDFDTRDGRQVRMKHLTLDLTFFQSGAAADITFMRIIIFVDKQANEATPVVLDYLQVSNMVSRINLDNRHRFYTLFDRVVTMSNTGQKLGQLHFKHSMSTLVTFDDGNAGTIADITTNAIYLLLVSTEGTNLPNATWFTRIRFLDN